MGSFRVRRTVKIAPGIRLNINKRSVGVSAGVRGARGSINSDGRSTRSIGVPGTGLYYRSQTGPRGRGRAGPVDGIQASPARLIAHIVGVLTVVVFIFGILKGHSNFAGTVAGIGIVVYVALRVLRGILDPLILWLLTRNQPPVE
jgi:hypothetical protein